jgi:hypothetical protein
MHEMNCDSVSGVSRDSPVSSFRLIMYVPDVLFTHAHTVVPQYMQGICSRTLCIAV